MFEKNAANVPSWMPQSKKKHENVPLRLPFQCSFCTLVPFLFFSPLLLKHPESAVHCLKLLFKGGIYFHNAA